MKVLQINSVCGIGSTGRIATDIHNILIEKGHESYIAYGRDIPKNCDNAIKIGTNFDNYSHVVKTRILDKHGFGSEKATLEFIDKVKEINPDVIHLHNIHGYYINIEVLFDYLKEANKSVLWTLHDCWSFTGHCSHFDYIGCEKWKTGCFMCPQKKEYPKSNIVDNSDWNYEKKKELFTGVENLKIITPSAWLANLVKDSFLNEYPIEVVNNGIDLSIFKPTFSDVRSKYNLENKFVILGVANVWNERKGFGQYIELSKLLSEDEVIVLVGVNNKQKKILPENILGITKTNDVLELVKIYSAADVFLNLTFEDTYPTVNLEASSCGTPIFTYDSGGARETIISSEDLVIKSKNINFVLSALKELKNKKNRRNGQLNDIGIKKNFDKYEAYTKYINIYNEIINNMESKFGELTNNDVSK